MEVVVVEVAVEVEVGGRVVLRAGEDVAGATTDEDAEVAVDVCEVWEAANGGGGWM